MHAHGGGRAGRCVGADVGQEVVEDLAEAAGVARDQHGHGPVDVELDWSFRLDDAGVGDGVRGEGGEVDGLALDGPTLVEAGEQQELLDQHAHARCFVFDAVHGLGQVVGATGRTPAEELGVATDRGQRRPQLVRRVGDEATQAVLGGLTFGEGALDPAQHGVEGLAQAPDLRARPVGRHSLTQVAGGDGLGRAAHARQWAQTEPHQPQAEADHGDGDTRRHEQLDVPELSEGALDVAQREGDCECLACVDDGRDADPESGSARLRRGHRERLRRVPRAGGRQADGGQPRRKLGCEGGLVGDAGHDGGHDLVVAVADLEVGQRPRDAVEPGRPPQGVGVAAEACQRRLGRPVEGVELLVDPFQQEGVEGGVGREGGNHQSPRRRAPTPRPRAGPAATRHPARRRL